MPLTPTPGSDAVAAGMPLVPGGGLASDLEEYINQTRDFIAQRTSAVTPIAKGGTGAATAAAARSALGITADTTPATGYASVQAGLDGKPNRTSAQYSSDFAARDANIESRVLRSGDTMSGHLYLPAASAAVSSYAVAYINGDGRVSRGASAAKYKKHISDIDPASLGDIWPQLVRYQMRSGDGTWKYGYIADRLAENADQEPFVVYALAPDETGQNVATDEVESIDFIALLLAQNAQLHQAVDLLAQRLDALEES